ncbi:MAG: 3-oxoacyl-ACP reductase FabG [Clostridia bacterium]|nr:3-oxoacyl-ACP reductase FabG [Clostridia bacterium]MDE7328240.1 3-oxoacyl-ACP reductase FabG [Clostridia bacterium]
MKNAIISGASRGIGKAVALALAKRGYRVIVNYLSSQEQAELLCKQLDSEGASAVAYKADMADPKQICDMVEYVRNAFGSVDLVVANAGVGKNSLLVDHSDEDIRKLIDVNLVGVITLCREAAKVMLEQKYGNIITISSMWGQVGGSCESVYSATKGGIIAFTKALAKELALSGVRVNCVSPGFIDTDINSNLSPEDKKLVIDEIPLSRAGAPEDVAEAIAWLADDKSSYITGQVLGVNGGLII